MITTGNIVIMLRNNARIKIETSTRNYNTLSLRTTPIMIALGLLLSFPMRNKPTTESNLHERETCQTTIASHCSKTGNQFINIRHLFTRLGIFF